MVIKHHGIDGPQWGVRNGPPYPLNRQKSGRIVKRNKDFKITKEQIASGEIRSIPFKLFGKIFPEITN